MPGEFSNRLITGASLTVLLVLAGVLITMLDITVVSALIISAIILLMNGIFYYVQGKRRGDFIPIYPDMGIAVFFSITTLNAMLLFFRADQFFGTEPITLGLYYPIPLPRELIFRGLMIVALANFLFILTFYSRIGPAIFEALPDPPATYETDRTWTLRIVLVLLLSGIVVYLLSFVAAGASITDFLNPSKLRVMITGGSGILFVLASNYLFTVLPLFFVIGVSTHGIYNWPTAMSFAVIGLLSASGHLSFAIIPVLGLLTCYHLLFNRVDRLRVGLMFGAFATVAIFGKLYRTYSKNLSASPIEFLLIIPGRMITDLVEFFSRFVIGRLSPFESFVTVIYFIDSGKVTLHFGRTFLPFIGNLLPRAIYDKQTYFGGGYYTNVLYRENVPAVAARPISDDFTAALGAFGDWYLNFHLAGIVVGTVLMALIFRVWTLYLTENTNNMWVVAFHATNIWYIYQFWTINTRTTRGLLLHSMFFVSVFYFLRYYTVHVASHYRSLAESSN